MRFAGNPPSACSACYGQYPDRRHIDFETSWDGPFFKDGVATGEGVVKSIPISIDELVICETCISAAAALLGMSAEHFDELMAAKARAQNLAEQLEASERYRATLEEAVAAKPEAPTPKRKAAQRG